MTLNKFEKMNIENNEVQYFLYEKIIDYLYLKNNVSRLQIVLYLKRYKSVYKYRKENGSNFLNSFM